MKIAAGFALAVLIAIGAQAHSQAKPPSASKTRMVKIFSRATSD